MEQQTGTNEEPKVKKTKEEKKAEDIKARLTPQIIELIASTFSSFADDLKPYAASKTEQELVSQWSADVTTVLSGDRLDVMELMITDEDKKASAVLCAEDFIFGLYDHYSATKIDVVTVDPKEKTIIPRPQSDIDAEVQENLAAIVILSKAKAAILERRTKAAADKVAAKAEAKKNRKPMGERMSAWFKSKSKAAPEQEAKQA